MKKSVRQRVKELIVSFIQQTYSADIFEQQLCTRLFFWELVIQQVKKTDRNSCPGRPVLEQEDVFKESPVVLSTINLGVRVDLGFRITSLEKRGRDAAGSWEGPGTEGSRDSVAGGQTGWVSGTLAMGQKPGKSEILFTKLSL